MSIRIKTRQGESVGQMLRRFKKLCEKEGLTKDIKRKQYFEKPSERRRRAQRKRSRRNRRRQAQRRRKRHRHGRAHCARTHARFSARSCDRREFPDSWTPY